MQRQVSLSIRWVANYVYSISIRVVTASWWVVWFCRLSPVYSENKGAMQRQVGTQD